MKIFVEEFDVKNSEPDICRFLESIIESDEFDKNTRKILNYGHSFGHSIESATNYKIPHSLGRAMLFWVIPQ